MERWRRRLDRELPLQFLGVTLQFLDMAEQSGPFVIQRNHGCDLSYSVG